MDAMQRYENEYYRWLVRMDRFQPGNTIETAIAYAKAQVFYERLDSICDHTFNAN